jgi:quinol monooxygenase YgiN
MPKFATVSTIEAAVGRRDQILRLLEAHKARCLKEEPDTLQFEILLPRNDDTKTLLFEVYRDAAAFDVHRNGPSFTRWQQETAGMEEKLCGTRCTPME